MKLNTALLIALLFFSFNVYSQEVSKIIVKVNNQVITSRDLDEYCKVLAYRFSNGNEDISADDQEFRGKALERLIEDTLVLGKAKQEGIEIPFFRVDNKIEQLVSSHPSRKDFEESLIEKGLTIALLRKKIKDQYLLRDIVDKHIKSQVVVSPKEISDYYFKNPEEFYSAVRYSFYIAQSSDESILKKISSIIKNEGISEALIENSDILKKMESDLKELKLEIAKIFENLEINQCKIVRVDSVYYLIFLEEKIFPTQLSLEEVKEAIYAYLWDVRFKEKFIEWLDELKEDALIKKYDQ
ncbi:MAG: SurA N-terminal domain-containing protein [Candidatus Susulua stagnicola]|nr:SurA N-terminal domain-containing protein [Candidatus Susulua stagnicola]